MNVLYNPDLLSDDALRRQFVARGDVLERLVEDLRRDRPGHSLIVGARGMGKTTLLRRLRLATRDDPSLGARWIALSFPEEQYNVARLADFWANCVDALADHYESSGRGADAERLDDAMSGSARGALAALLTAAEQENRGLILLVDNLDLVLGRLGEADQWELRRVLGSTPGLVLIGASANLADESAEYGKPFYEFLHPIALGALSVDEMRTVLTALGQQAGPEAARVVSSIEQGRLRTLHALTGGNPRTTSLVFEALIQDQQADSAALLNGLLDRVTPLYKARFEALPDQLQLVLDAVALAWDPVPAAVVAERTELAVNLASAQLTRLIELGHVEKVPLPRTKKLGFQVAERFFNIWYLMRASRRLRRRLGHLVRFMEMLWGPSDRLMLAGMFAQDGAELSSALALAQTDGADRAPEMTLAVARALAAVEGSAAALRDKLMEMIEPGARGLVVREAVDREVWLRGVRAELTFRREEIEEAGFTLQEVEEMVVRSRSLVGVESVPSTSTLMKEMGSWAELQESYLGLLGPLGTDALWSAALSPGWSGPDDRRGQGVAMHVQPSPWLPIAMTLLQQDVAGAAARAALHDDLIQSAGQLSYAARDGQGLRFLATGCGDRGRLSLSQLALSCECQEPPDWSGALSRYLNAADFAGALRAARALRECSPPSELALCVLAIHETDTDERRMAVDAGLAALPSSEVLLAAALELARGEHDFAATGTYAARLHDRLTLDWTRERVAKTIVLHPRERGIALARQLLANSEATSSLRGSLSAALATLGEPAESLMTPALKGLRGKQRAEHQHRYQDLLSKAPLLLAVSAPVPFRLGLLCDLAHGDSTHLPVQLALLAAGGHHAEALAWIQDNDRAEALSPLVRAIEIHAAGDRELLLGLAPELRAPVETVLTHIDELVAHGGARIEPNAAFNEAWDAERARIAAAASTN